MRIIPRRLGPAAPAPLIAGTGAGADGGDEFEHGDLVEITGSGFGSTMPTFGFAGGTAGPLELTSLGATPTSSANTDHTPTASNGFNWTRYAIDAVILDDSERGKVIGVTSMVGAENFESIQEFRFPAIPENGKFMSKYYARYAPSPTNTGQIKFTRLNSGVSNIEDTDHNALWTNFVENGGQCIIINSAGEGDEFSDSFFCGNGTDVVQIDGNWQRVETKIVTGTQGSFNSEHYYRRMRNAVTAYIVESSAVAGRALQNGTQCYPTADRYITYMWQNYRGNGHTDMSWAVDDHYIQTGSFACVELWNSATPALATIREIQEPTSWSDGSITVRLNRGGLPDGTYYLVVLDDTVADTVLASREITLVSA